MGTSGPITRCLHTHYILGSTFARILLFLEQSQVSISGVIGLFSPASAREIKKQNDDEGKGKPIDSLFE